MLLRGCFTWGRDRRSESDDLKGQKSTVPPKEWGWGYCPVWLAMSPFTEGRQGGGGTGGDREEARMASERQCGRQRRGHKVGREPSASQGGGGLEIVEKVGGGGGVGVLAPLSGPPPFFVQLLPTVRATEGWGGGAGRVWGAGCGSSPESTACCSLRQPATGWREGGTGEGGGGPGWRESET